MAKRLWGYATVAMVLAATAAARAGGGNTCGTATLIGKLPYSDTGSTCGFTDNYDEHCPASAAAPDVVYRYTPTADQCIGVSLCMNTSFDSKLYVYGEPGGCPASGSGETGLDIACDDDGCLPPAGSASRIAGLQLVAGQDYWFVVDGSGDACGAYEIHIAPCGTLCQTPADCDDDNECTIDACIAGMCAHANVTPGTQCADGDVCTAADQCMAGACSGTPIADCEDCNMNGVPDDLDIAAGTSSDCNLNQVPDECDIASGTSLDNDMNGVPDECSLWTPPPRSNNRWGTAMNWTPEVVPDNTPMQTFSVTIAGVTSTAILNINAEIDTLRLLGGAALHITQPVMGEPPNLSVAGDGGAVVRGPIRVAGPRRLTVSPGPLIIDSGGRYERHPSAPGPVSAELRAARLTLLEGTPGAELSLEDLMTCEVLGDLRMIGVGGGPLAAVVCTPPILNLTDIASATIHDDFQLLGAPEVHIDATSSVTVGGDFDNNSSDAMSFEWAGTLTIESAGAVTTAGPNPQAFEVAGRDLGEDASGYVENFAIGILEISAGAAVTFGDAFDNDGMGQGACTEALYVDTLILRAGAAVTLDACRVYYGTLINEGATITFSGDPCAALLGIVGDCDLDGDTDLDDYASLHGCFSGPDGKRIQPACQCADLDNNLHVDLRDWSALQILYTGAR